MKYVDKVKRVFIIESINKYLFLNSYDVYESVSGVNQTHYRYYHNYTNERKTCTFTKHSESSLVGTDYKFMVNRYFETAHKEHTDFVMGDRELIENYPEECL